MSAAPDPRGTLIVLPEITISPTHLQPDCHIRDAHIRQAWKI